MNFADAMEGEHIQITDNRLTSVGKNREEELRGDSACPRPIFCCERCVRCVM